MPFGQTERAELAKLRFTTGRRMETPKEGGFNPFRLRTTLSGRTWHWHLGNPAALTLRIPTSATTLAADIHDGKLAGGGGPLLYKELRLEGALSTSYTNLRGTHYRLVLQGRGNNCLNAGDFRSWHLEITGRGAKYQLYGTFR